MRRDTENEGLRSGRYSPERRGWRAAGDDLRHVARDDGASEDGRFMNQNQDRRRAMSAGSLIFVLQSAVGLLLVPSLFLVCKVVGSVGG